MVTGTRLADYRRHGEIDEDRDEQGEPELAPGQLREAEIERKPAAANRTGELAAVSLEAARGALAHTGPTLPVAVEGKLTRRPRTR